MHGPMNIKLFQWI